MNRMKWLWTAVLAVPLAVAGSLAYANSQARSYTCPLTGEELPCPKCCPLNQGQQQVQKESFTCPVTGEELPCEKCCPGTFSRVTFSADGLCRKAALSVMKSSDYGPFHVGQSVRAEHRFVQ